MLIIYYIILMVNIAAVFSILQWELKRLGPASVFWLSVLAVFLVPALFDPFVGYVQPHIYSVNYELDIFTLVISQAYVLVFLLVCGFGYLLLRPKRFGGQVDKIYFVGQINSKSSRGLYWLLAFLYLSIFAVFESYQTFGMLLFSDFGFIARRDSLSALSGFLLSYNLIICGGVFFWLMLTKRYLMSASVVILYLLLYFVMGGSRQPLIILVLPFVVYFLSRSSYRVMYSALLVIFFNVFSKVLEFLLYLRNLSGFEARLAAFSDIPDLMFNSQEAVGSSESSLRFAFYYFVHSGVGGDGFGELNYFLRTLFFWLPSKLDVLGIKPADFEYTMFEFYMPGYQGTMHPTFFGSVYADSGWFLLPWAVFFVAIYRFFLPMMSRLKGVCFFAAWGLFAYFYMMLARGAIYGPFVALVFGMILIYIFQTVSFSKKFRNFK